MTAARGSWAGRQRSPRSALAEEKPWLAFRVRGVALAVPVQRVLEVLPGTALTRDPAAPVPLSGFAESQDGQVAVIDLALRLDLQVEEDGGSAASRTSAGAILVVSMTGRRLGLQVDEVSGLLPINPRAVQPLPKELWATGTDHLAGLYPLVGTGGEQGADAATSEMPANGWLTLLDVDSLPEEWS